MNGSARVRRGASAAMMGGLLWMACAAATPLIEWSHWSYHALKAPPAALLAAGVLGVYLHASRHGRLGSLGRAGLDLCAVVFALLAVGGAFSALAGVFGLDGVAAAMEILRPMEILLATGSLLFGASALQAGTLPRGGAALILVGAAAVFGGILTVIAGVESAMVLVAAEALFGLGWAWTGYGIRRGFMEEVSTPDPATIGHA